MDNLPKPEVLIKPALHKTPLVIFLGVLFLAAILVLLNYFNILPLSKLYPKTFGFLPHQALKAAKPAAKTARSTITCPVSGKVCQKGITISSKIASSPFVALAYENLASGSAVLAIIPGKYSIDFNTQKNDPIATVLKVINQTQQIQVTYEFKPQSYISPGALEKDVKQGEIIGWISKQSLIKGSFDKLYSLVVTVQNLKTGEYIKLNPAELIKN